MDVEDRRCDLDPSLLQPCTSCEPPVCSERDTKSGADTMRAPLMPTKRGRQICKADAAYFTSRIGFLGGTGGPDAPPPWCVLDRACLIVFLLAGECRAIEAAPIVF